MYLEVIKVYCKNCGYENEDGAPFCENCGADLSPYYRENALEGEGRRRKVLILVVAAIILFTGVSVFFLLEDYSQSDNSPDPRAINMECPYCGAGPDTMVAVRENSTHIKWYCQYCDKTWWEPIKG